MNKKKEREFPFSLKKKMVSLKLQQAVDADIKHLQEAGHIKRIDKKKQTTCTYKNLVITVKKGSNCQLALDDRSHQNAKT